MTSWKNFTFLCLSVFSLVNLSEEHCYDYLKEDALKTMNLTDLIPIIDGADIKSVISCTLEKYCDKDYPICHVWNDCFYKENRTKIGITCGEERGNYISTFNLLCLIDYVMGNKDTYEGCKYEPLLNEYTVIVEKLRTSYKTTTYPTTTKSPTTTESATTATTLSSTTSSSKTTLLSSTTTSSSKTTLSSTTTTPATTTSAIGSQSTVRESHGFGAQGSSATVERWKILLFVSLALNLILPLGVYLWQRQRSNRNQMVTLKNGNGIQEEIMLQLPKCQCHSIIVSSAEE